MVAPKGFIRTGTLAPAQISKEQKVQLLRRGNELFNQGKFDLAERIFVTLHYSDGLTRLGDLFYKQGNFQKAAIMYQKAPSPQKFQAVCKQMAEVVRIWLSENATTSRMATPPANKGGAS
jgi:hypothetical protein